jgi:hypothetical protein
MHSLSTRARAFAISMLCVTAGCKQRSSDDSAALVRQAGTTGGVTFAPVQGRSRTGGSSGTSAADGGRAGVLAMQAGPVAGTAANAGAPANAAGAGGRAGSSGSGGGGSQPSAAGSGAAADDPSAVIFDLTKLHDVRVDVAPSDVDSLRNDRTARIAATATIDGQKLSMIVTHCKGYSSASSTKPSLVFDLDDTVKNQKFDGMTKLVVNNAMQDPSFLNEHLAYEFIRKAGLPAPRTAHAVVTLNGEVLGLYILEEDINKQYLARWFGADNKSGNLYEGSLQDFALNQTAGTWPNELDLKGEADEGRTRDDIIALAALAANASDADYAATLDRRMDFDAFVTAFAIDMIVGNWDDYFYGSNNYYLYHSPADDRFVLLLRGMDFLFSPESAFPVSTPDAKLDPFVPLESFMSGVGPGRLAVRLRAIPALETRLHAEVGRLVRTAWDVPALSARIAQVATMLHTNTRTNAKLTADIANFDARRAGMIKLLTDRRTYLESVTP